MLRHRTLAALLADHRLVTGAARCAGAELDALLAWGRKPSARLAERLARRRRLALWRCEDAFLRSLELGPDSAPLGLVLDDAGIYYDAGRPCRLERLIAAPHTQPQLQRAEAIRRLWCEQRVSKYNGSREAPAPAEPFVLVVDQTAGDLSIGLGGATAASFETMLATALSDHPGRLVVVKTHPDVVRGRKRGHFQARQLQHPLIRLEASGGHPAALLERAAAVYVVTSQLGFEALLWERPVHCFGMPFYAGWGLTRDRAPVPERRQPRQLGDLIHAALVDYAVYVDPHRHQRCALEELITAIGLQRRLRGQMPERIEAFGFTPWKQRVLRRFLAGSRLRFKFQWQGAGHRAQALAVWGRRARPQLLEAAGRRALPLLHAEDGFLRSVGLGADLIDPISWVIDRRGIYYDASAPSDLEHRLATGNWDGPQLLRARRLRRRLVEEAITKYNLRSASWRRPAGIRRLVLVVGQVEADASIRLGAPGVRTNLGLLQAVRAAEPSAYLLYKPHPDVVAGLCSPGSREATAQDWCDEVVLDASIQQLFTQVDALHVITSIAGFEALLRELEVHTWGLPFYAGWGLSHDRLSCDRRGRRLSLDALVHAALIDYPRYVSRHSGLFIEPEQAIEELLAWRSAPPMPLSLRQRIFRHWGRLRRR
ncbi:capsular polysaccharide biosynthesis protein [Cyanobium sp. ATX 6A2]|nr:capsular polysaccharide biosynthesis protein [Cyanobium sp. ATX 6A2]